MGMIARKPNFVAGVQQMGRPTCASAQSDQHLCNSLSKPHDSTNVLEAWPGKLYIKA